MGIRSAGSGGSANSLPPACGSDHAGPCRSVRCVGTGPSPAPPASGRGDSMTITVLSGLMRPLVESRLPGWVEPRFFANKEEAMAMAPQAEIGWFRSEEHTSELQSLMRTSYAVFCLKKNKN